MLHIRGNTLYINNFKKVKFQIIKKLFLLLSPIIFSLYGNLMLCFITKHMSYYVHIYVFIFRVKVKQLLQLISYWFLAKNYSISSSILMIVFLFLSIINFLWAHRAQTIYVNLFIDWKFNLFITLHFTSEVIFWYTYSYMFIKAWRKLPKIARKKVEQLFLTKTI